MNEKENNSLIAFFEDLKTSDKTKITQAVDVLTKMRMQKGYGVAVVYAIQDYFFGKYEHKGILADAIDEEWNKRLILLYHLDKLIREEPNFKKTFQQIKKEMSERKIGFKTNDMERRMAFIWALIGQRCRV